MDQKIIIKSTLIILILSLIGLFSLIISSNKKIETGIYYIKCNNGSVVSFNRTDLLVCNGPNPFQIPVKKRYEVSLQ